MSTVTPTVRLDDRRLQEEASAAASSPRRVTAAWLRGERTKQWLRRKAVAAVDERRDRGGRGVSPS